MVRHGVRSLLVVAIASFTALGIASPAIARGNGKPTPRQLAADLDSWVPIAKTAEDTDANLQISTWQSLNMYLPPQACSSPYAAQLEAHEAQQLTPIATQLRTSTVHAEHVELSLYKDAGALKGVYRRRWVNELDVAGRELDNQLQQANWGISLATKISGGSCGEDQYAPLKAGILQGDENRLNASFENLQSQAALIDRAGSAA